MDKELNQAVVVRSKFCNKVLKLETEGNRLAYIAVQLLRKIITAKKATVLGKLSSITDNKLFWKAVSPLFTKKISPRTRI